MWCNFEEGYLGSVLEKILITFLAIIIILENSIF